MNSKEKDCMNASVCPSQLREFGLGQLPYTVFLGWYSAFTLSRYSVAFARAAAAALYNKNVLKKLKNKNKNAEAEITLAAFLDPPFLRQLTW